MTKSVVAQAEAIAQPWKPYPEYRDSDVEWLREIPAHWGRVPVKRLARPGYKTFTDGDWIESPYIVSEGIRLIQTGNIGVGSYKEQGYRFITAETFDSFGCTEVMPGDVLICRLADPVGRACLAPDLGVPMITSVDVAILKPSTAHDHRFIVYSLSTDAYLGWMQALCRGGTRDRVSRSMLGAVSVLAPPLREQHAIAGFLDRETASIDALIAKKERLIELLQEKRTALISHAVTKGLQPDVPMKDSGIEWVGEIPAHWRVAPLRYLTSCLDGKRIPLNSEQRAARRGPYPYWGANGVVDHIDGWLFDEELVLLGEDGAPFFDRFKDVAFAVKGKIWVNNHIHVLRPAVDMNAYFLAQSLNNVDYAGYIEGSTRDKLTQGRMKNILVQRPPAHEQRAIEAVLRRETAKIDALKDKVRGAVDKLNEYRAGLISAAVTGKIDVRQAAP